jgi:FkbM family methyltransferase
MRVRLVQGVLSTARLARLVEEPVRFSLAQVRRESEPVAYHLRGSDVVIHLRHSTPDINSLEQIFRLGHYEMPPEVRRALAGVEPPLCVVDLGANVGLFAAYVRKRYGEAEITAFEPDPGNAAVLRRSAETNPLPWKVVAACADVRDGEVQFAAGHFTNSRVETNGGGGTRPTPAVDVFRYLADVDLLKVDIEGSEWAILGDPRFGRVPAEVVALEYHAHLCPTDEPSALAHELLRRAGYETAERQDFDAPPGHGMIWAWKAG